MNWVISAIVSGISAFAATNIDDIVMLTLFFAQADDAAPTNQKSNQLRPRQIVLGQYLGFLVLIAASIPGFVGGMIIPDPWIGLLGFLPIAIGIQQLIRPESEEDEIQLVSDVTRSVNKNSLRAKLSQIFHPNTLQVAAVTIANGGDNIATYVPLFASSNLSELLIILAMFGLMIALWCAIARYLSTHPKVAPLLTRYAHWIVPLVLIGLGIHILISSESYLLLQR
ncbi:cadmium resistance transporter [Leptolyngbya ohadii]|uniref:cadmium resistance transporter n=1 Tax=Leptolyngbya ohadii TaxID=1962290 RepID=UPI000B59DD2F|nr:cadmium resistance transporter [Leptolyngbya ohadii]